MIVEAHRCVCISDGQVRELVIIVDVVVIKLDVLQAFIVRVLDFCDANHEDFSLWCMISHL
jgi:hypothetical protein